MAKMRQRAATGR